ncbi:MAG: hypothetical protein CMG94_01675 [Marinoscillum sp.]|nr:hypothetical protein [Marinoscillum sp.]OUX27027.1 MAG: hypothetical protein CBE22_00550 [Flammeovirgaceae bacterium TMED262]
MHKSNTIKRKGYLIDNRIYLFLAWIMFSSCQDNYRNCLDLEYGTEYIKITGVSESDKNYFKYFCKKTNVFGIKIYATENVDNDKMLHAASILAEYLDNDEDGIIDNQRIVDKLIEKKAWILMAEDESESRAAIRFPIGNRFFLELYEEEVSIINGSPRFDASLEEILHLITQYGYAEVYTNKFGENKNSEIAKAMDEARGGYFKNVPNSYPSSAWYTYDDKTCNYSCQITEYTYWALTSILGAQEFPGRLEEIQNEWKLNTKEKVKNNNSQAYGLLTNPEFKFPTYLPDGKYR